MRTRALRERRLDVPEHDAAEKCVGGDVDGAEVVAQEIRLVAEHRGDRHAAGQPPSPLPATGGKAACQPDGGKAGTGGDPRTRLRAAVERYLSFVLERPNGYAFVIGAHGAPDGEVRALINVANAVGPVNRR